MFILRLNKMKQKKILQKSVWTETVFIIRFAKIHVIALVHLTQANCSQVFHSYDALAYD
jgi:hypothetical protein